MPLAVLVEYELLAVRFDGEALAASHGPWAALGRVSIVLGLAISIATSGVLLSTGWASRELSRAAASVGRFDLRWGGLHVLSYLALFRCSAKLFDEPVARAFIGTWTVAWFACGLLTLVSLVKFAVPDAAGRIARILQRLAIGGVALGTLAWFVALQASDEWPRLARITLRCVVALLGVFGRRTMVDESRQLVGADGFAVEISAPCSGIQGMGLIFVFVTAYLVAFRDRFRFPGALVLPPIAMLVAFGANILRIVALVLVGAHFSADVAFGGFHSQAGWLMFCAIALSFVALVERGGLFKRDGEAETQRGGQDATPAFLLPELTLLAVSLCTGLFAAEVDFLYPVRIVCTIGVLLALGRHFRDAIVIPSWEAAALGAVVFVVWLLFAPQGLVPTGEALRERLMEWSLPSRSGFLFVRILGSVFVVPIAEELAFRGYLQRRLVAEDFASVSFRSVTVVSVLVTAVCFGALHQAVAAGTIASLAYSAAAYLRGRLGDAIAAHAITNALIAVWVLVFGRWDLWV